MEHLFMLIRSWSSIYLALLCTCEALDYSKPIQAACIPLALAGRDIRGSAITGSGKTAAFALPTLERLLFRPKSIPAIRVLRVGCSGPQYVRETCSIF